MGLFNKNLKSEQHKKKSKPISSSFKNGRNVVKSGFSHKKQSNTKFTKVKRGYTHSVKSNATSGVRTKTENNTNSFKVEADIKEYNVRKEDINIVKNSKAAHTLLFDKVQSSVSALLQLKNATSSSKTVPLFNEEAQTLYMKVKCIKIPEMTARNYRFQLPHPLVDESSEICFFVPDLKKGKRFDHEPTIEHYKEIFRQNNITGISQIIPLRQMLVEYDQYEARRRLISQFDMFLADGRICGHMLQLLGKEVYRKRKLPAPVDMRGDNLKREVDVALSKTLLMMNGQSNEATLRIGHTNHSVVQLVENIMAVAKGLSETYPGGWENIRSLHIFLPGSALIPMYLSLKSSNFVEVPVMVPVTPKNAVPVEGELTTFLATHVTVWPGGQVFVKTMESSNEDTKMGLTDSDLGDFKFDEKEMENEVVPNKRRKVEQDSDSEKEDSILSGKGIKVNQNSDLDIEEDEDSDAETMAEAAEKSYLSDERIKVNQKKMKGGKKKTTYTDERIKVERVSGSEKRIKEENKDTDDEHEVSEAAENAYLRQWARQWNSNIEENKKLKRKKGVGETKLDPSKKKQKTIKNKKKLLIGGKMKRMEKKIGKLVSETKVDPAKKKQKTVKNKKECVIGGKIKRMEKKIGKGVSETKVNPAKMKLKIVKIRKEGTIEKKVERMEKKIGKVVGETKLDLAKKKQNVKNSKLLIEGKIKRKEKKLQKKESNIFKKETAQTVKDTRTQRILKAVKKTVKKKNH